MEVDNDDDDDDDVSIHCLNDSSSSVDGEEDVNEHTSRANKRRKGLSTNQNGNGSSSSSSSSISLLSELCPFDVYIKESPLKVGAHYMNTVDCMEHLINGDDDKLDRQPVGDPLLAPVDQLLVQLFQSRESAAIQLAWRKLSIVDKILCLFDEDQWPSADTNEGADEELKYIAVQKHVWWVSRVRTWFRQKSFVASFDDFVITITRAFSVELFYRAVWASYTKKEWNELNNNGQPVAQFVVNNTATTVGFDQQENDEEIVNWNDLDDNDDDDGDDDNNNNNNNNNNNDNDDDNGDENIINDALEVEDNEMAKLAAEMDKTFEPVPAPLPLFLSHPVVSAALAADEQLFFDSSAPPADDGFQFSSSLRAVQSVVLDWWSEQQTTGEQQQRMSIHQSHLVTGGSAVYDDCAADDALSQPSVESLVERAVHTVWTTDCVPFLTQLGFQFPAPFALGFSGGGAGGDESSNTFAYLHTVAIQSFFSLTDNGQVERGAHFCSLFPTLALLADARVGTRLALVQEQIKQQLVRRGQSNPQTDQLCDLRNELLKEREQLVRLSNQQQELTASSSSSSSSSLLKKSQQQRQQRLSEINKLLLDIRKELTELTRLNETTKNLSAMLLKRKRKGTSGGASDAVSGGAVPWSTRQRSQLDQRLKSRDNDGFIALPETVVGGLQTSYGPFDAALAWTRQSTSVRVLSYCFLQTKLQKSLYTASKTLMISHRASADALADAVQQKTGHLTDFDKQQLQTIVNGAATDVHEQAKLVANLMLSRSLSLRVSGARPTPSSGGAIGLPFFRRQLALLSKKLASSADHGDCCRRTLLVFSFDYFLELMGGKKASPPLASGADVAAAAAAADGRKSSAIVVWTEKRLLNQLMAVMTGDQQQQHAKVKVNPKHDYLLLLIGPIDFTPFLLPDSLSKFDPFAPYSLQVSLSLSWQQPRQRHQQEHQFLDKSSIFSDNNMLSQWIINELQQQQQQQQPQTANDNDCVNVGLPNRGLLLRPFRPMHASSVRSCLHTSWLCMNDSSLNALSPSVSSKEYMFSITHGNTNSTSADDFHVKLTIFVRSENGRDPNDTLFPSMNAALQSTTKTDAAAAVKSQLSDLLAGAIDGVDWRKETVCLVLVDATDTSVVVIGTMDVRQTTCCLTSCHRQQENVKLPAGLFGVQFKATGGDKKERPPFPFAVSACIPATPADDRGGGGGELTDPDLLMDCVQKRTTLLGPEQVLPCVLAASPLSYDNMCSQTLFELDQCNGQLDYLVSASSEYLLRLRERPQTMLHPCAMIVAFLYGNSDTCMDGKDDGGGDNVDSTMPLVQELEKINL